MRRDAMLRALRGSWVPVVRRGRVVRMEFRRNDRLAVGILSGRDGRAIVERREQAVSRRKYKLQLQEIDRRREAERRRADAIWAEHQAHIDNPFRPQPRIRRLYKPHEMRRIP